MEFLSSSNRTSRDDIFFFFAEGKKKKLALGNPEFRDFPHTHTYRKERGEKKSATFEFLGHKKKSVCALLSRR